MQSLKVVIKRQQPSYLALLSRVLRVRYLKSQQFEEFDIRGREQDGNNSASIVLKSFESRRLSQAHVGHRKRFELLLLQKNQ